MFKTAFIFPGQGSQYIGMARDFYEKLPECKEIFDIASRELNLDMQKLCFEENELLNKTEYTQAAMLTSCVSILMAVLKSDVKPDIVAGLSLGEYSALVANGVFTFSEAVKLVRKRGIYMEHEVPNGIGSMSAILGMDKEKVEEICQKVSKELNKVVEPANFNCPGQIVISGDKVAVLKANEKLKEAGAKRAIELNVSGPFHSSLLKGAGEKLAMELEKIELHDMNIPYLSNVTGKIVSDKENIKKLLEEQVYKSVRWQECVENMINDGVERFIEIGPGKTLSGFIKKIDKTKEVINIEKLEDLEKLTNVSIKKN
ncbi:ACP S-malonyltransferase [Anaeromicropila herbilytica]|uniref:Malonyl CoA-acyl carrier protein transacylase n=1 Tax=Anaeromicropila herbilytica TaxID=2785025 RepID=A0A7R7EH94_9FIRM|nr:ACP S-malonyltransferase [Anaeromicropila herbilytica]BCN28719.1 malonyl CoA-acyl carrier protein transacylase [Anaeromicropila herbilytica]